jgi:hypothetical protein
MDASKIVILFCVLTVCLVTYLHIKKYIKKTDDPSIEQSEFYIPDDIINNHKKDKNIYIVRVYSTFDENEQLLNNINKTDISAYSMTDINNKSLHETIQLHDFINGEQFTDNTMCLVFNKISNKVNIPTLDSIFSPMSVSKNIYLNVGMKSKRLPVLCMSQYDRCFIHVLKGLIKIRLYDPSQSKYLYRDFQKKIKCIRNTDNFYNSKINFTSNSIDDNFPEYKNAKYTEILLRAGNLMYLPNFWWFTIEYQEDSVSLFYTCNTIISYIYNKMY